VGHSFIKAEMAAHDAVFGGEHSGHFYVRDFWNADSGMLAALHTLAALGGQALPLSALLTEYDRYAASGEINSRVADTAAKLAELKAAYADREQDEMDGLTVELGDGAWFNVRPSNTEPLLRLNVEARDESTMAAARDAVLAVIRSR
jgi:phosphomannomutase